MPKRLAAADSLQHQQQPPCSDTPCQVRPSSHSRHSLHCWAAHNTLALPQCTLHRDAAAHAWDDRVKPRRQETPSQQARAAASSVPVRTRRMAALQRRAPTPSHKPHPPRSIPPARTPGLGAWLRFAAPASCPQHPSLRLLTCAFPHSACSGSSLAGAAASGRLSAWLAQGAVRKCCSGCSMRVERLRERHHRRRCRPDDAWADTGCRRPD